MNEPSTRPSPSGEVWLIGCGPGDPELLTLRAARLIRAADVVVHDRLIAPEILAMSDPRAERIYVGKADRHHAMPQGDINRLLVERARAGLKVARLKGGDPLIFGRGGEEIEVLHGAGVAFQVVPGITAASGCTAYAGIPLTHRDHAHACVLVTGHGRDGMPPDIHWPSLVLPGQTLVFYMGLNKLPRIVAELAAHGMRSDMPAAVIERGTTNRQRVIAATLGTLQARAEAAGAESPALIVVGDVVALRERMAWFAPSVEA